MLSHSLPKSPNYLIGWFAAALLGALWAGATPAWATPQMPGIGALVAASPAGQAPARPNVYDANASPETHLLRPGLGLGLRVDLLWKEHRNTDLDKDAPDAHTRIRPRLTVALHYQPHPRLVWFNEARFTYKAELRDEAGTRRTRRQVLLRNSYIALRLRDKGWSVRAGRQRIRDPREWLYAANFDALRLLAKSRHWRFHLAAGRVGATPSERHRLTVMTDLTYRPKKRQRWTVFAVLRSDRTRRSDHRIWLGTVTDLKPNKWHRVWLQTAAYLGRAKGRPLFAHAFDFGWSVRAGGRLRPFLTVAGAVATGDSNPDKKVDRTFRQTGLENNRGSYQGAVKFHYYGELLRPELSNLAVTTVGLGIRPRKRWSLEWVYHHFHQYHVASRSRLSLDARPTGYYDPLGDEVDMIVGMALTRRAQFNIWTGFFQPGRAFTRHRAALVTQVELSVTF